MDVLKLLSRSTTLSKKLKKETVARTPSSGESQNPQLFGQETISATEEIGKVTNSKKRKREDNKPQAQDSILFPDELDFFSENKCSTGVVSQRGIRNAHSNGSGQSVLELAEGVQNHREEDEEPGSMNEDECRLILRTHKIKITVLENELRKDIRKGSRKKGKEIQNDTNHDSRSRASRKEIYPVPLTSFSRLQSSYGISKRLADNIQNQGYKIPTEVQLGALPLLLDGSRAWDRSQTLNKTSTDESSKSEPPLNIDLMTVAPTGSGKTLAFLIPVIHSISQQRRTQHDSKDYEMGEWLGPKAVVIAPTRELAAQIVNEGRKLAAGTRVRVTLMRKGMLVVPNSVRSPVCQSEEEEPASDDDQISEDDITSSTRPKSNSGQPVKADILVSTPLALLNAIKDENQNLRSIPHVQFLVLDEADVLLDPLFREQTLNIWTACTDPLLRVSFWSATMGSNIEELIRSTIEDRWKSAEPLITSKTIQPKLVRLVVGLKDSAIPNIAHKLTYAATERGKLMALRELLHPTAPSSEPGPSLRPPFLVFTQTIPRAIALHSELMYDIPPEAGGSARLAVLHSDLSDSTRDRIMTRFRKGEIWVLITTDLLARGVDFRGVNGVVNYDVPNSSAAYVHRAGRTGRAGREGGVAVTLYTKEDIPYIKNVANIIAIAEKARRKDSIKEGSSVQQWLLDSLPKPSKREKKLLKKRGVEARNSSAQKKAGGRAVAKMRISTRSGFDRRLEHNRKGAIAGNRARLHTGSTRDGVYGSDEASGSEFAGFDD